MLLFIQSANRSDKIIKLMSNFNLFPPANQLRKSACGENFKLKFFETSSSLINIFPAAAAAEDGNRTL